MVVAAQGRAIAWNVIACINASIRASVISVSVRISISVRVGVCVSISVFNRKLLFFLRV